MSELPSGASDFSALLLHGKFGNPGQVQWDGNYMTYESRTKGHIKLLRLLISNSVAKVVRTIRIKGIRGSASLSWIYGGQVFIGYSDNHPYPKNIGAWDYPANTFAALRLSVGAASLRRNRENAVALAHPVAANAIWRTRSFLCER